MPPSNSPKILPMSLLLPFFLFPLIILHAPPATAAATIAAIGVHGYGGEKQVLTLNKFKWTPHQTNTPNCFPQRSRTEKSATILELHHRDSCFGPRSDWNQRFLKHLLSDQIRVRSIQSRIKTALSKGADQELSQAQIPITSGTPDPQLCCDRQLGGRNVTLIVDTGSDITWVQCQPCGSCYNQQEPLFNPSQSPTYKSVVCKSTTCENLEFATGKSGVCGVNSTNCNYSVSYGDGSYTEGDLASDNLVIGTVPIEGFVFGCGRDNSGLFGGASSAFDGFSNYRCFWRDFLVLFTFGDGFGIGFANSRERNFRLQEFHPVSYTNLLSNPMMPTFYFLNLTGISIGGVSLQDPSFGKREMLIDSGTVITRLPPSIYKVVKSEFLNQFSGFPKAPGPFPSWIPALIYLATKKVEIPTVKLHMANDVKFTVDVTGILYFAKIDASQVCLALAGLSDEEEIGIIGNYQQKNTRVVYNTKEFTLGFAKETCTSD
ncbi:LOW QUALITY PROTEIN: hypothetical protein OSB04_003892 [Centaurea solstitialis]|uniref:Peptidase A1 domain-containing protein n=1 Tax=Centaurea solstitialis TaxID=347529 RepID=A0AA38U681_9ASTR|nr:LOW QUALITY PROTEIN: hypothetical protein OSB04_003892 [Centaurea solstitialis]